MYNLPLDSSKYNKLRKYAFEKEVDDEKVLRKSTVFHSGKHAVVWLCCSAGTANQISF
jgi:hypothetical protein